MKELILIQIENAISSLNIEEAYRLAESIDLYLDDRLSKHFNLDWFSYYLKLKGSMKEKIITLSNSVLFDLSYNNLTYIPKEIENLTNLEHLDLSNNKLEALPTEICLLTNLRYLYLGKNNLKELPKEVEELIKRNNL